jgi:hypothetical protein
MKLVLLLVLTCLTIFVHVIMTQKVNYIEHFQSYEEYKRNYERLYGFVDPSEIKQCNCDCIELQKELDRVCIPVISQYNHCRGQVKTAPQRCNTLLDLEEQDYQNAVMNYKERENKTEIKRINLINEIQTCKEETRIIEGANEHLERQNKEIEAFGSKMSDTVTDRDKEVVKDKVTGKLDKCKTMTKISKSHKENIAALEDQLNQARANLAQYYNNISQVQSQVPQANRILDRCIEVREAQAKAAAEAAARAAAEEAAKAAQKR